MKKLNRRSFIKQSAFTAAATGAYASMSTWAQVDGANNDIRIAIVGLRGKGDQHLSIFKDIKGVRIAAVCDPDTVYIDRAVKKLADNNSKVESYIDYRKLLENKDIDAVVIATPNHWHSLMGIWACQAGKDAYVEKPVSHNISEGRRLVEAARKYNRIVQTGTQSRSDNGIKEAIQHINEGNLGKILISRGFCYKRRASIGKVDGPQKIPESINYDLWTGPAPLLPLTRKSLHYDWHWVWPTGNGDVGNQGIHQMDIARWAIGSEELAPAVFSVGGRFGYDDDGETPNTQIVYLDYKPAPIIFEVQGLPLKKDMEAMDNYRGIRVGNVIQCENGYWAGGGIYDNDKKRIKQFGMHGAENHQANFIDAVRSRKQEDLRADILKGHISSALCHMGNISHQLGANAAPGEIIDSIKDCKQMSEAFERFKTHLDANEVNIDVTKATLGAMLTMDTKKEVFTGNHAEKANTYISREYRAPYLVPEKV